MHVCPTKEGLLCQRPDTGSHSIRMPSELASHDRPASPFGSVSKFMVRMAGRRARKRTYVSPGVPTSAGCTYSGANLRGNPAGALLEESLNSDKKSRAADAVNAPTSNDLNSDEARRVAPPPTGEDQPTLQSWL